MAKFCANLSFMFTELPFIARYKAARDAGFKCVETGFPFGISVDDVSRARREAGVSQVLINIFTGDVTIGEVGLAATPGKEKEFRESLRVTVEYAKALGAKKVHVMSGKFPKATNAESDFVYRNNIEYAARILEAEKMMCVIEPINNYSVPNYYLNCYDKAIDIINSIDSSNVKLLLDIFHLQQIRGNITHVVQDFAEYIGHVQIAQVPDRHEPDTAGEINYKYVLDLLASNGYNDWIGLEYKPQTETVEGLRWIKDFGYSL